LREQTGLSATRPGLRLTKALQPVYSITMYMQAAQDITVGARVSKTQYQYTLVDADIDELDHWAPILFNKLKTLPQLTDVASDQQSTGRILKVEINRQLAQQLGINPSVVDSTSTMRSASVSRPASIRGSTSIS
jgi:multidrug efflux pump subunit AcrB